MNINYKRLFNLNIGHDYFADGFDRYIQLAPTVETSLLLRNGKMLLKNLPHGITVLYQTTEDEITPLVQLNANQKFVFALTTENKAGFLAVSNLDESGSRKYQSGKILLFKNNPGSASVNSVNPEIISHEILDSVRSSLFTYSFKITGNPATVKLRVADADGALVSVGTRTDGTPLPTTISVAIDTENKFSQQIDLKNKSKGKYTITILNNAETTELLKEEIYLDDALASKNIIGIAEIIYDSVTSHLYGDTEQYLLQFKKAETFWKYYIVNKSGNIDFSTDSLKIQDLGSTNGNPYIINQFKRIYAGILLTADNPGSAGNSISLQYSDPGDFIALLLSGNTFAGGTSGVSAKASVTLINNSVSGYTLTIGGESFTEGSDFTKGLSAEDTATALVAAINANGSLAITAEVLQYDILINSKPSLVFGSDQEIPFFEKPKLNIELQKTSDDQVIMPHLPNPSPKGLQKLFADRIETELYVFI